MAERGPGLDDDRAVPGFQPIDRNLLHAFAGEGAPQAAGRRFRGDLGPVMEQDTGTDPEPPGQLVLADRPTLGEAADEPAIRLDHHKGLGDLQARHQVAGIARLAGRPFPGRCDAQHARLRAGRRRAGQHAGRASGAGKYGPAGGTEAIGHLDGLSAHVFRDWERRDVM
jgi:hypothetical protein